jgi:hypothetical protein
MRPRPMAKWGASDRLGAPRSGPTTDHDGRTQRTSTVSHDTSDKWFTLDTHRGPIWGSRGREFKSRQPDRVKYLLRRQIHTSKYLHFMIPGHDSGLPCLSRPPTFCRRSSRRHGE